VSTKAVEQKTKRELAELIGSRIGVGGTAVAVFYSPKLGWDAILITRPRHAFKAARMVREIAGELRANYELSD
jgi:hypothetical protein